MHASHVYSFQVLENISTVLQNFLGAQERYICATRNLRVDHALWVKSNAGLHTILGLVPRLLCVEPGNEAINNFVWTYSSLVPRPRPAFHRY